MLNTEISRLNDIDDNLMINLTILNKPLQIGFYKV